MIKPYYNMGVEMKYHLLYTLKDGTFVNEEKEFATFVEVENWIEQIGAIYWEIGL